MRQPGIAVAPPQPGQGVAARRRRTAAGTAAGTAPAQGRAASAGDACSPATRWCTEPPAQKIINKKASFSGLDKITGRIINFDEDIGETVQFGALRVKTDACYTRPATEAANTDAFVEVDEITLQGEVKRIFSGWMYAASPGLHGVEHPIYDIWLTDCKGPDTDHRQRRSPIRRSRRRRRRPAQKRPPPPKQAAPASAAAAAIPAAAAAATAAAAAAARRAVRDFQVVSSVGLRCALGDDRERLARR